MPVFSGDFGSAMHDRSVLHNRSRLLRSALSVFQAITDARLGEEMAGARGIFFELATKRRHVRRVARR